MKHADVLILSRLFWPEGGGAELATYLLAEELSRRGLRVVVVSGTRPELVSKGCCSTYVYFPLLGRGSAKPFLLAQLLASKKTLRELIKGADTIYIPSNTLLPLVPLLRGSVERIVVHLHDYQVVAYTSIVVHGLKPGPANDYFAEFAVSDSLLRALASAVLYAAQPLATAPLRYADHVLFCSRRQYEIIVSRLPWLAEKGVIVPNIPPRLPRTQRKRLGKPLVLYGGGESLLKGYGVAMKVLSRILGVGAEAVYYGFRRPPRLRLPGLRVLGKIPHEEVIALHERAYALLFPSLAEEPLPYTVVEAALLGTVPVAARVGGVPEIVAGTPAERFLFDPWDPLDAWDKLEQVLAMGPGEVLELGEAVRERVLERYGSREARERLVRAVVGGRI